jgi:hypothetical protein
MFNKMRFWIWIVGVIAVWLGTPFIVNLLYPEMSARGQFGDLFGSINALFSGLAFVGLIYTIQQQRNQLDMQRTELELQRQELKLQREEMAGSRAELANQARMQQALIKATIAQVSVAAVNAMIEARKMESDGQAPGSRQKHWEFIQESASTLAVLAEQLKSEVPNIE